MVLCLLLPYSSRLYGPKACLKNQLANRRSEPADQLSEQKENAIDTYRYPESKDQRLTLTFILAPQPRVAHSGNEILLILKRVVNPFLYKIPSYQS